MKKPSIRIIKSSQLQFCKHNNAATSYYSAFVHALLMNTQHESSVQCSQSCILTPLLSYTRTDPPPHSDAHTNYAGSMFQTLSLAV
jgi:hypothetical protein